MDEGRRKSYFSKRLYFNLILYNYIPGKKKIPLTWEQNYVQNLIHLHQLRYTIFNEFITFCRCLFLYAADIQ